MARTDNLTNFLTDVAAAIKEKKGSVVNVPAANFDTEILALPGQGVYQTKSVTIASNGTTTITPDQNYDAIEELLVTVAVPINRLQTKSYNFTENTVTTLRPDAGYEGFGEVGLTINVSSGEDLDSVITAQENKLEALETILEGKIGASGGGEPNIFVQTTEPETKKGIWLKKNAEPEHYTYDENIFISGEWMADGTHANIPQPFHDGSAVAIGTDIYVLGGYNGNNQGPYDRNYKYNTLNNTWTQLTNIPYTFTNGSAVAIETDIYILGGYNGSSGGTTIRNNNYKYDTLTDTYTQLTSVPSDFTYGSAVAIGTDIYLLGGANSNKNYKYDTLTDTYTQMTNIPYHPSWYSAVAIGTDIYLLGGNSSDYNYNYKYNTLTDTYTQLTNIPYKFYRGYAVVIGTDIYLLGSSESSYYNYNYKYNTLTDTYTQLTDIPYAFYESQAVTVGIDIYLLGSGNSSYNQKVQVYSLESKTYSQDNLVVISQGKYNSVGYEIELYNNMKDVTSPKYTFADAWYYTTQGGLETDIPTYYGNGTAWVNIKNPPQNQGGAE